MFVDCEIIVMRSRWLQQKFFLTRPPAPSCPMSGTVTSIPNHGQGVSGTVTSAYGVDEKVESRIWQQMGREINTPIS